MKKILIVEDDPIISRLYQYVFERAGFRVEKAADGEQAMGLLESSRPDLVVVDLMLPKVHGIEVIKYVRTHPVLRPTPIIVLSNAYLSTMVKGAWHAGANVCLSKSECSPEQLLNVACDALGINHLAAEAEQETAPPRPTAAPAPAAAVGGPSRTGEPAPPAPARRVKLPAMLSGLDEGFRKPQEELRRKLQEVVPPVVAALRATSPAPDTEAMETHLLPRLRQLYQPVHALTGQAGLVESLIVSTGSATRIAGALEALLTEVFEEPELISPSTLRIIASAAECLMIPFEQPEELRSDRTLGPLIMAVDDEIISLRTISSALELASLRAISLLDPTIALTVLEQNSFDLIFLDVEMPGMTGFELCAKLRTLPNHKSTPVVFVTGLGDFQNRARSILSGGNDLIAKPFLLTELAVKALTYVLRGPPKPAK